MGFSTRFTTPAAICWRMVSFVGERLRPAPLDGCEAAGCIFYKRILKREVQNDSLPDRSSTAKQPTHAYAFETPEVSPFMSFIRSR